MTVQTEITRRAGYATRTYAEYSYLEIETEDGALQIRFRKADDVMRLAAVLTEVADRFTDPDKRKIALDAFREEL